MITLPNVYMTVIIHLFIYTILFREAVTRNNFNSEKIIKVFHKHTFTRLLPIQFTLLQS